MKIVVGDHALFIGPSFRYLIAVVWRCRASSARFPTGVGLCRFLERWDGMCSTVREPPFSFYLLQPMLLVSWGFAAGKRQTCHQWVKDIDSKRALCLPRTRMGIRFSNTWIRIEAGELCLPSNDNNNVRRKPNYRSRIPIRCASGLCITICCVPNGAKQSMMRVVLQHHILAIRDKHKRTLHCMCMRIGIPFFLFCYAMQWWNETLLVAYFVLWKKKHFILAMLVCECFMFFLSTFHKPS